MNEQRVRRLVVESILDAAIGGAACGAVRQVIEQVRSRASDCHTSIRTGHPLEAIDGTNSWNRQ